MRGVEERTRGMGETETTRKTKKRRRGEEMEKERTGDVE